MSVALSADAMRVRVDPAARIRGLLKETHREQYDKQVVQAWIDAVQRKVAQSIDEYNQGTHKCDPNTTFIRVDLPDSVADKLLLKSDLEVEVACALLRQHGFKATCRPWLSWQSAYIAVDLSNLFTAAAAAAVK